jgi:hypothetical protein
MYKKLSIATRFYGLSKGDTRRLVAWVDAALLVVPPENIFIAVHSDADLSGSLEFLHKKYPMLNGFGVVPWGKVVQAPNALLIKSAEKQIEHIMYLSTEYPVTESIISLLMSHFDNQTLVVGASLLGHDFKALPGSDVIVSNANGLQIPWNTCAIWSVERLVHTGFVLAADALRDPDNAGMEEMGTIVAQQILWPGKALAKLILPRKGDLVFNTYGWSVKRRDRYIKNLTSKNARSEDQLKRLSLPTPLVLHMGSAREI